MCGHAGLLPYIDLACVLGVPKGVDEKVGICGPQGWMDRHHALSLILLNLAGGECVEDIRMLEADPVCADLGAGEGGGAWEAAIRAAGEGSPCAWVAVGDAQADQPFSGCSSLRAAAK